MLGSTKALLLLWHNRRRSKLAQFLFTSGTPEKNPTRATTDVFTSTTRMRYMDSGLSAPLAVQVPIFPGDQLSYTRGTQVSGDNYDTANANQGTFILYIECPWNGNPTSEVFLHTDSVLVRILTDGRVDIRPRYASTDGQVLTTAITWTRKGRYLIAYRFDADNYVTGTRYSDGWVNGAQHLGATSGWAPAAPGSQYIGSNAGPSAMGGPGIIFMEKYDYVWSDADLATVYGGGTVVHPSRVNPRPTSLKASWSPGLRAASGNWTGATAAEGCFCDQTAYHATTNTDGNAFPTTTDRPTFGGGADLTAAETTLASDLLGMQDTMATKLTLDALAVSGTSVADIGSLTAGHGWFLDGVAKRVDATNYTIEIWSGTAGGGEETTLVYSTGALTNTAAAYWSATVSVGTGHNTLRTKITVTGTAGQYVVVDAFQAHRNLLTNGEMEGTYTKTGAAITTSTAATTTYSATRATDATAWTLTNAVVGMIVEGDGGKYGYITAIGANYVDVAAWVGGTPTNGQAAAVYSAIAPGWTATGTPRLARVTGRSGTYAQQIIAAAANNGITQSVTVANTTWHTLSAFFNPASGTAQIQTTSGAALNATDTTSGTGAYQHVTATVRSSATTLVAQLVGATAGTYDAAAAAVLPLSPITLTATPGSRAVGGGVLMAGGDSNTIPGAGVLSAPNGAIAIKLMPYNWDGANSRTQTLLDTSGATNRILLQQSAANNLDAYIWDAAGNAKIKRMAVNATTLPANTPATVAMSWNAAGEMKVYLNTTAATTDGGTGTGILGAVPTTVYFGSQQAITYQADTIVYSAVTLNRAPSDAEMLAIMASL